MNLPEDLFPALRPLVVQFLESFGAGITSEAAGIRARVDSLLTSRIYGLVVLLTFVSVDDPETELAAVSVEWREGVAWGWEIDATGRDSVVIAEYAAATDGVPMIDMGSVASALRGIENIIDGWKETILAELRP